MIITREELEEFINFKKMKSRNFIIGFTSGAFDIVHYAHAELFKKAKEHCDILIVGINTDESIKKYKGINRPFRNEKDRISLINSIEDIDYCFLFDEKNNARNIEILKPDIYFKGNDYNTKNLSSKKLVEEYGGKIVLLDTPNDVSSSKIIKKIQEQPICLSQKEEYEGIVFLDRDGVINKEVGYLHKEEDFELIDGAAKAIKLLNDNNYAVIVVTNQPGIGVGLFSEEDFFKINKKMIGKIHHAGAQIDKVYYCPDIKKTSEYKKPNEGMIKRAIEDGIYSLGDSWIIGDRLSDCKAGETYCMTIGLLDGLKDNWVDCEPDYKAYSLLDAVENIILKDK